MMKVTQTYALFVTALAAVFCGFNTGALAVGLPKGTIVLSKTKPDALLIWDASKRMTDLAAAKTPHDRGMRTLETDGVAILELRAKSLSASYVELRVVYILSPLAAQYGNPALADKGTLVILRAKRSDISREAAMWTSALQAGHVPKGLTVTLKAGWPDNYN